MSNRLEVTSASLEGAASSLRLASQAITLSALPTALDFASLTGVAAVVSEYLLAVDAAMSQLHRSSHDATSAVEVFAGETAHQDARMAAALADRGARAAGGTAA